MSFSSLIHDQIIENERDVIKQRDDYDKLDLRKESKELNRMLLEENPQLEHLIKRSESSQDMMEGIRKWVITYLEEKPDVYKFAQGNLKGRKQYELLDWKDIAAIRLYDYLENEGTELEDLNLRGEKVISRPFELLWLACKKNKGDISADFFVDMIYLFRQFFGKTEPENYSASEVRKWMERHPSGLDQEIVEMRKKNKQRILQVILNRMETGLIKSQRFYFEEEKTRAEKLETLNKWWDDRLFHLRFAVRDPDVLNEMLDHTLDKNSMEVMNRAKEAGIPFFVNPYYLSLINVHEPEFARHADIAIRDYIFYSHQLVDEYGHIVAWEREDIVEPGKPNAAGWLLPSDHNVHRRYPEVAILIPDTIGRACGGLCVSCQRMYDFQRGNLNFNLDKLKPGERWPHKLDRLMTYFEKDSQLRDILITGGDALMSTDRSLKKILDAVYEMAKRKIEANEKRSRGKKFAEMLRVRIGTRLPVYLPQRITDELIAVLADFKEKASRIGIRQFVIQTHFESAMEMTPEAREGLRKLLSAGWIITNQQVFTAAASRRGHTAKLREVLNEAGVLPYYTFSVKGYKENSHNFATNERAVQEQREEKALGKIAPEYFDRIRKFPGDPEHMIDNIHQLINEARIPFLATDRNVLNLPGVGKSLTFRTIGITHDGRRILEFDHDSTRWHSPIIHKMGKVRIIESKSIGSYLWQLHQMGEDINEYESIFDYSIGETEQRMPVYEYPEYEYDVTNEITNFEI